MRLTIKSIFIIYIALLPLSFAKAQVSESSSSAYWSGLSAQVADAAVVKVVQVASMWVIGTGTTYLLGWTDHNRRSRWELVPILGLIADNVYHLSRYIYAGIKPHISPPHESGVLVRVAHSNIADN